MVSESQNNCCFDHNYFKYINTISFMIIFQLQPNLGTESMLGVIYCDTTLIRDVCGLCCRSVALCVCENPTLIIHNKLKISYVSSQTAQEQFDA